LRARTTGARGADWFEESNARWPEFVPSEIGTRLWTLTYHVDGMIRAGEATPPGMAALSIGYSARVVEHEFPWRRVLAKDDDDLDAALAPWSDPALEAIVVRDDRGRVNPRDYGDFGIETADQRRRLQTLIEYAKRFIEADELFARIATCKVEYWAAMTDVAVQRLRPRMPLWPLGGRPPVLAGDVIAYLLRTGYVLRRIEEALGEEPRSPEQLDRDVKGEIRRGLQRS
jgi:hypothetical protein